MQIKTTRLSCFDGLELKEATFRGHVFPEHFHDAYSIGIIEHGIENLFFEDKKIIAHANSVVAINPYDIHANSFFDKDCWKYRTIYVNPDILWSLQQRMGLFPGKKIWFPRNLMQDDTLFNSLLNFHNNPEKHKVHFESILMHLLQHHALPHEEVTHPPGIIDEAADFIQFNYSNKILIDEMASGFGMDKYRFIRLFKKQIGLTPGSYLLLQRINRAKTLIQADMSITEVALETGFYDQSHFTHYFKKYIGISPKSYKLGVVMP